MKELVSLLRDGIAEAVSEFERSCSVGNVAGLALLVDGDFQSVYAACVSQQFLDEAGDDALLFMPFDWNIEVHSREFELASATLECEVKGTASGSYDDLARAVSSTLGWALERGRQEIPALRNAFLIPVSAGGGRSWQHLEGEWVKRLNGPEAFERWSATVGGG